MNQKTIKVGLITLDKDAADLVDSIEQMELLGFFDCDTQADGGALRNLGDDARCHGQIKKYPDLKFLMAADPPDLKIKLIQEFYGLDRLCSAIAPDAYIAKTVQIGDGCLIQRGVKLMADVEIGRVCKLNCDAVLHHDVKVGDFSTIAPGARLLGKVKVADKVYIASGAILLPGVSVGSGAIIGAGAVVTKPVLDNTMVIGVPARPVN